MGEFFDSFFQFGADCIPLVMIAVFLENIVFTRALGTSTSLLIIKKKYNLLAFGAIIVLITTVSSIFVYLTEPLLEGVAIEAYIRPLLYILIIGIVYILTVIVVSNVKSISNTIIPIVHISAFNCAVLGALLLGNQLNMRFSEFIAFGFGTGCGFVIATYLVSLGYEKVNSDSVPPSFKGLPATFIYMGIISLAFYGLIGSELPF